VQILRGLTYIHTVPGVCHRDIKPQNILVCWFSVFFYAKHVPVPDPDFLFMMFSWKMLTFSFSYCLIGGSSFPPSQGLRLREC